MSFVTVSCLKNDSSAFKNSDSRHTLLHFHEINCNHLKILMNKKINKAQGKMENAR